MKQHKSFFDYPEEEQKRILEYAVREGGEEQQRIEKRYKQKMAEYDKYDKEVSQRLICRWHDLQQENEDRYNEPCTDLKSIVIALGALLLVFGIGFILGGKV